MKKLLGFPILFLWLIFSLNFAFADDCLELSFDDWDICINIEKDDDEYTLDSELSNTNWTVSLKCDILIWQTLYPVWACNWEFEYSRERTEKVKLYVRLNNEYKQKEAYYDFDDWERWDSIWSSNEDIDNFYLTTDDSSPETNDRVDLTIRARDDDNSTVDDYRWTVQFKVYYRTSSSSSRRLTTSSTYYEIDDDYEDDYTFTSSDDGEAELDNFIKFKKEYDYKVRVEDEDDDDIYGERIFYVDDNWFSYNGFSSKEIDKVEAVYDVRPSLIRKLENDYPKLKTNNTRQSMSDELYEEMENIIQWDDSIYDDFDEFYDWFLDRYSYTMRAR